MPAKNPMTVSSAAKLQINSHWGKTGASYLSRVLRCSAVFTIASCGVLQCSVVVCSVLRFSGIPKNNGDIATTAVTGRTSWFTQRKPEPQSPKQDRHPIIAASL